jgi:uncharacterized membrane protein YkoI
MTLFRRRLLPLMILPLLAATPALAGDDDQDRARRALQAGEIRPLEEVLRAVRSVLPGDVVGVELDRDDGRWIYEIKVLSPDGHRREVEIDARDLRILEID